jgi:hypothetical protein
MITYFARHNRKLDIDEATRARIWKARLIAIHFPRDKRGKLQPEDNSSIDPQDYDGSGRRALSVLAELAQDGGYVCAEHYGHEEVQIGFVQPDSKIKLHSGKWGKIHGFEGRAAILKTVQLHKVNLVSPLDYPTILVGRPRQGTLNRWPNAGPLIEKLVKGKAWTVALENLSPDQQEILCSEFLRSPKVSRFGLPRLAHLILPVGRTMKDIDLLGVAADGRRIFAQVTRTPFEGVAPKLNKLRKHKSREGSYLILFCDIKDRYVINNVTVFPIRTVFSQFTTTDFGKRWLEYAAGKRR